MELSHSQGNIQEIRLQSVCEKCDGIDAKIVRYRNMSMQIGDKLTDAAIRLILSELHAQKQALPPEGEASA